MDEAPPREAYVKEQPSGREAAWLWWGLIPSWAKGGKPKPVINARSDTAATKPTFRAAFKRRRCLIQADGFYEWRRAGREKQPFFFALREDEPFAFAGLWEEWKQGETQFSFACFTQAYR